MKYRNQLQNTSLNTHGAESIKSNTWPDLDFCQLIVRRECELVLILNQQARLEEKSRVGERWEEKTILPETSPSVAMSFSSLTCCH